MAYSLIANTHAANTDSGVTTSAIDTTGANLLVVATGSYQAATIPTLTDSKSNSWTGLPAQEVSGDSRVRVYYCAGATVGSGHTFSFNGSVTYPAICVAAWAGARTPTPDDQQNGTNASGVNSVQPGSVTPGESNELLITAFSYGAAITPSINGGFSISDSQQFTSSQNFGVSLAYLVQTAAAAANPTWSWSDGTRSVAVTIHTFKAEASTVLMGAILL